MIPPSDSKHMLNNRKKLMMKNETYVPTTAYYKEKYQLSNIEVIGLMVGARGTITSFFTKTCKSLDLNNKFVVKIAMSAIKGSIRILRKHQYGSDKV